MMGGILEDWYVVDQYNKAIIVDISNGELVPPKNNYLLYGTTNSGVVCSEFQTEGGGVVSIIRYIDGKYVKREYELGIPHRDYWELLTIYNDIENRDKILTNWSIGNDGVFRADRYSDLYYIAKDGTLRHTDYYGGTVGRGIEIHNIYQAFSLEGRWIVYNGTAKVPEDRFDEGSYYVIWSNNRSTRYFNADNGDIGVFLNMPYNIGFNILK